MRLGISCETFLIDKEHFLALSGATNAEAFRGSDEQTPSLAELAVHRKWMLYRKVKRVSIDSLVIHLLLPFGDFGVYPKISELH